MTTTDFDKIIWRDALTFVDFFATWCGPCQMMHPAIDKFQREMNGRVDVYKVDIDDRGMLDAVHRYNIMSVPTLMFFRRGEVLWRESGLASYDHLVNVLRASRVPARPQTGPQGQTRGYICICGDGSGSS